MADVFFERTVGIRVGLVRAHRLITPYVEIPLVAFALVDSIRVHSLWSAVLQMDFNTPVMTSLYLLCNEVSLPRTQL